MRRRMMVAAFALLSVLVLGASPSFGSSHREAPLITGDPEADLNDLYAFRDFADPSKVNLILTAYPLEEPGDAPNYYRFGDNVRYDINIDRNGDARPDITYRFRFQTHVRNGDVFVYNFPGDPVTSLNDSGLNVSQTYDAWRINWGAHPSMNQLVNNARVVPNNVGSASMPNFGALVNAGVKTFGSGMGKVWAGQTDDPFFLDLGAIGDSVSVRNPGFDTLGGFNTQAIALQVPIGSVKGTGHPTVSVWAATQRQNGTNILTGKGNGAWRQIERLGMPLTNEVLIGLNDKDRWNHVAPRTDAQFSKYFLNPVLATVLGAPDTNRQDILATFMKGLAPVGNVTGGPPADALRLNLNAAPTNPATASRLGALGGDADGFPNGRRLADDVTDIELQVVAGALIGTPNMVGDSVDTNDRNFRSTFPYLGLAHSGAKVAGHMFVP
ncbi:MAG: hypothetical protein QOF68_481 [Gaiellales bacterium]|nr:hypothetical protein [Gaiellales bacterium]